MSPRKQLRASSEALAAAVSRIWIAFGIQVREARRARRWPVQELARRAGVSANFVYRVEGGSSGSVEAAARIGAAFGWRAEMALVDPRRRADGRPGLSADPVHSAMGELETAHLRGLAIPTGVDEPYQHYQFAGRADVVAWDTERRAFLHIENRTRFPDFQEMAGTYNEKRAYLAGSIAGRLGMTRWASETHVIAALWSSEVLHAVRMRTESFRSLCPDDLVAFDAWWRGEPPLTGKTSTLIALDPLSSGRQRTFIDLEATLVARPRYAGYAHAASKLATAARAA